MSDAELLITFRIAHQNVLQRGVAQDVRLEARRDGKLIAPVSGAFSLFGPLSSTAIIDAEDVTIVDMVATFSITALQLPESLAFSELYQERWSLLMPDGTTRTPRRETAVAPFLLYPVLAEIDITQGEYPGLVNELGDDITTLQPFIDEAWKQNLEWLYEQGRWPDMMLSNAAFRKPHRETTLYLIFKELFRITSGTNRWQVLMDKHEAKMDSARSNMTSRLDRDRDGLPDDPTRVSSSTVVHRNANRRRLSSRNPRW